MRRRSPYVKALLAFLLWHADKVGAGETNVEAGRRIYDREGCAMCHSVAGVGKGRYSLDGVGRRLDKQEIRKWIVSPREMKPEVKKRPYRLSEEDLNTLIEYLDSLDQ